MPGRLSLKKQSSGHFPPGASIKDLFAYIAASPNVILPPIEWSHSNAVFVLTLPPQKSAMSFGEVLCWPIKYMQITL